MNFQPLTLALWLVPLAHFPYLSARLWGTAPYSRPEQKERESMRLALSCIVAPFIVTTSALAQPSGQVVSYHLPPATGDRNFGIVPEAGIVITDIAFASPSTTPLEVRFEQVDGSGTTQVFWRQATVFSIHFNSGIPFTPGSTMRCNLGSDDTYSATISGYIPTTAAQGNVPAVSTWGLVILGLLVVSAGSVVMMKRWRTCQ